MAAFTALELGKFEEARALADGYLKKHAQHVLRSSVEYVAAESLLRDGQYDDAVLRYDALLKRDAAAADRPCGRSAEPPLCRWLIVMPTSLSR